MEVFLDEFGEEEKVTFRKALCPFLDDFEVPRGFQNEPKNISHASPPLPGDVAVWARCPWGPLGSNLGTLRVEFRSFSEGSRGLNG